MSYSNQVILEAIRSKFALLPVENAECKEALLRAIVQILTFERDKQIKYMIIKKEVNGACETAARKFLEHHDDAEGVTGKGA